MGGKSTYLRQAALLVILAQLGCFVPARSMRYGIVDRIYTRIGASDNLARGRSTFMVEMTETATILNTATNRSLILLDEMGRGTATFDGLSLAWAALEYLHAKIGARTLFATHYHELTLLADQLPRLKNVRVGVKETAQGIVFMHSIEAGPASKSYGIEVARLAGLPASVLQRARQVLKQHERSERHNVAVETGRSAANDNVYAALTVDRGPAGVDGRQHADSAAGAESVGGIEGRNSRRPRCERRPMTKALRKQVGQLLIVGLEGTALSALEKAWLRMVEPSGVILFRRNIETAEQAYQLLRETSSLSETANFRCFDLEGGLVDRLRDLIAPMPSAAAVGAAKRPSPFVKHGKLIGREARLLGFNTVFAPVLDLALQESKNVMRTRTVSSDPEKVVAYAGGFLDGLSSEGILGCGKHFPGLGGGAFDSHHATPVIERDFATLWANDLIPYRQLKAKLPMVMVSHASYPAAGDSRSASVSRFWMTEVLTKRLGYRGLIVSDDMEMGGILTQTSIEDAVVRAVLAGTHLVEICKDPALVLGAYEALLSEAERSTAFRRIVEAVFRTIVRAKKAFELSMPNKPPLLSQIERLRGDVDAFRLRYPEPSAAGVEG